MPTWTAMELKVLADNYDKLSIREIAEKLNKSYDSVKKNAQRLAKKGILEGTAAFANRPWESWEFEKLKSTFEIYKSFERKNIAKKIAEVLQDRSITAIENKLFIMGLGFPPDSKCKSV